jgi:hypothetical protein
VVADVDIDNGIPFDGVTDIDDGVMTSADNSFGD